MTPLAISLLLLAATAAPADNANRFPKPEPKKFLAEYKILQPDGSVYRRPIEDWEGARKRVASDPAWTAWLKEKQTAIDAWMARHHDRTTWQAGKGGDFVSPIDGAPLIWTDDVPGEEAKTVRSKTGAQVEVTPDILNAWVDKFRKAHMEMISEAARMYRLTGDKRYADWSAGQLDFYANNLENWPLRKPYKGQVSRLGVEAFNDAVMLTSLVDAARLLFDWAEPQRRQLWFDKLFKPEVEMLESIPNRGHNHTLWHLVARIQVALLYNDEAMWKHAVDDDPVYGFRALIHTAVTSEYLWCEQSFMYHDFVLMAFQPVFEFAGLVGKQDRLQEEAAIVENMMLSTMLCRFPDDTLPNPSDSRFIGRAPSHRLTSSYRYFPTQIGLTTAMKTYSWDTLIDPPANVATPQPYKLPQVVSYNMESSRFALLKQGPWQVFFHYGQAAPSHVQSEALNWSAYYENTPITTDPGTVGYGSKLYKGYYARGLNHNVPLINGEGEKAPQPGQLVEFDAAGGKVTAELPEYLPGVGARRTLRIDGNKLIEETVVTVKNDKPSKLGLVLHLEGKPQLPAAFEKVKNFADGRPEPFKQWKEVRSATFQDRAEIDVVFPAGRILTVTFATPGKFTLYQGVSPALPPQKRAGFYLETEGTSATFTTTLAPK